MDNSIDLVLINPGNRKQVYQKLGEDYSAIEPPFWAGILAAFIRERGFSVKIIDAEAEGWDPEYTVEKIIEARPCLAGISACGATPSVSSTPKMGAASKILNILKKNAPHIETFLYGIHPSALPERTLKDEPVDFVCKGECFYTVLKLLETLKSGKRPNDYKIAGLWYRKGGKIISNGWGKLIQNLDDLPFVTWDLLPMDKYRAHNWHCLGHINQRQPYAVIYTSLGCPFDCAYCNVHAIYDDKPLIRFRSPKKVLEEIYFLVKNYKIKNIKILDEIFVLKESHVIELCDLIIQRGYDLNMWAYARIDTINEKLLKKMKQAGINWLAFGIESGNQKIRNNLGKREFRPGLIRKAIRMTHNAGIHIAANFIFGFSDDDFKTMRETLDLAKELNCEYANFYVAMAYPGSELYNIAMREGVELSDSWEGFSQYAYNCLPLSTNKISAKEVLRFRDKAFHEYFSNKKYLNMLQRKFGLEVSKHIEEMAEVRLKRKLL